MKMASKRDSRQLALFLHPTPPPFSLAPSTEEIRLCSGCGKQIIARRLTADGESVGGYCDIDAHAERRRSRLADFAEVGLMTTSSQKMRLTPVRHSRSGKGHS